jgi:hypothetical protein
MTRLFFKILLRYTQKKFFFKQKGLYAVFGFPHMAHLLYMTFVDSQFKSHEMSLLFIVMCRVTYFWTPVFVSILR